ncbi:dTDP-4-dehydrorhamnose 3,5-epimerase family protein [Streptomyces sp. LP05-1]|uniref:dTDP-4-dehydrorhamnose 3,5-epimerase family protein n=1 Tax=Streptomyces pyxinae TaxID=2970734 RepID=A0ABT2CR75_9ACTN|nr:dTDP-4-dehydrorhamnose 3,5-epimerase family protein [Streptomyces sp. LP05-1]MCS0639587.1 dTDP-4-dehydrorhamnose 3,5-epimerase family protein [Streptomyces sp. LP05-1]
MDIHDTAVPDAYRIVPRTLTDDRGSFHEAFRYEELARATGHVLLPRQVNLSSSRRDTVRGLHSVLLPPGQAKYVACVRGAVRDFVADVRLGSPAFGAHTTAVLDAREGTGMFVAEGLAHGFVALTDDACVSYLCSTEYVPGTQVDIFPFDPELGLPWHLGLAGDPLLSEKDAAAPSLAGAADQGLLATYDECLRHYADRRRAARREHPPLRSGDGTAARPPRDTPAGRGADRP